MKLKWKDKRGGINDLLSSTVTFGDDEVIVQHSLGWPADEWFLTCRRLDIYTFQLVGATGDIEKAKRLALGEVGRRILRGMAELAILRDRVAHFRLEESARARKKRATKSRTGTKKVRAKR